MENSSGTGTDHLCMIGIPHEKLPQVIPLLTNAGVKITIFPTRPVQAQASFSTFSPLFSTFPTPTSHTSQASTLQPPQKLDEPEVKQHHLQPPNYLLVARASAARPARPARPVPPVVSTGNKQKAKGHGQQGGDQKGSLKEFMAMYPEQSRKITLGGHELCYNEDNQRTVHAELKQFIRDNLGAHTTTPVRGIFVTRDRDTGMDGDGWRASVAFTSVKAAHDFERKSQGKSLIVYDEENYDKPVRLVMNIEAYEAKEY